MAKRQAGKKGSLKAALSLQQSRLKKKQGVVQAGQLAEKSKKASAKIKGTEMVKAYPRHVTIPFKPTDHILLIGEGNFSFAHALVLSPPPSLEHLPVANVTATAYDKEDECYEKYPEAEEIVASLRDKGMEILFGIDATKLENYSALKGREWDKVMWNFPHAGKGITDQDRNILSNQMLILGFLRSASHVLSKGPAPVLNSKQKRKRSNDEDEDVDDVTSEDDSPDDGVSDNVKTRGTVLLTLRNVPPYTLWDVPELAKNPSLPASSGMKLIQRYLLLRSFVFHRSQWKGYEHRMTKGERAHGQGNTGKGGEDRTWEFYVKDQF